jgi:hypothetical protein
MCVLRRIGKEAIDTISLAIEEAGELEARYVTGFI